MCPHFMAKGTVQMCQFVKCGCIYKYLSSHYSSRGSVCHPSGRHYMLDSSAVAMIADETSTITGHMQPFAAPHN